MSDSSFLLPFEVLLHRQYLHFSIQIVTIRYYTASSTSLTVRQLHSESVRSYPFSNVIASSTLNQVRTRWTSSPYKKWRWIQERNGPFIDTKADCQS